jgi:UV DNA damage endonuclease
MTFGYACINLSISDKFKTITVKSANKLTEIELIHKVKNITLHNLNLTYKILQWNIENDIYMYRLTSNLIPLVTHSLLKNWNWWDDQDIIDICNNIKAFVISNNIRISFHVSPFCVINSPRIEVLNSSIEILQYHNTISNMLGINILVLHVGGIYNDKKSAINRFIINFKTLPIDIQNKIVLENDDKSFNVEDVLNICKVLNIRMCVDFHHDRCFISDNKIDNYLDDIIKTWNDEIPKCHISSGKDSTTNKSHADYINENDFNYYLNLINNNFDVMFESKSKELSILKLKNIY